MKIDLKFSKIEIAVFVVLLVTSPLAKIFLGSPLIGGALLTEGIGLIFFGLFGYAWMEYGLAKRGGRTWKKETVDWFKGPYRD